MQKKSTKYDLEWLKQDALRRLETETDDLLIERLKFSIEVLIPMRQEAELLEEEEKQKIIEKTDSMMINFGIIQDFIKQTRRRSKYNCVD
jgi:hypothetical protein